MTGKTYLPHADFLESPKDCMGQSDQRPSLRGYDLTLITYRTITQTKSRTVGNYWLKALYPENFIDISPVDAKRLGLKPGDQVKVTSASNPEGVWDLGNGKKKSMICSDRHSRRDPSRGGRFFPRSWALGLWGQDVVIDGQTVPGDPRRATGIHANAAMRVDPVLKNTGLVGYGRR